MTDDEVTAHFLARAACYRCGAAQVTDPHLAGLYRLVGEGLENLARVQKRKSVSANALRRLPPLVRHVN
jgi:hypothetical protein